MQTPLPTESHRMQDSSRTDSYRDRELLEAVLQNKDEPQISESGSRISALLPRTNGNLSRPSSYVSKRSINLSNEHLSESHAPSVLEEDVDLDELKQKAVWSLCLLSLASLILLALAVQLLLLLAENQSDGQQAGRTLLNSSKIYEDVLEVATAMATFVAMLDLNCLLVCSMQCFYVIKILELDQGKQRAAKYLHECSSSNYVAVFGFFVSVPVFSIALMLYIVMRFKSTPAVTAVIILSVGMLLCTLSAVQTSYHWYVEKSRADDGLPVHDSPNPNMGETGLPRNELSTLV